MKKFISFVLILTFIFSLSACTVEKENEEPKSESITDTESETEKTIGSWIEIDNDAVISEFGRGFEIPEGAEDIYYSMDSEKGIAEVYFVINSVEITARMKKNNVLKDISGMYYTWDTVNVSVAENGYSMKTMKAEFAGFFVKVGLWFDSENEMVYSLAMVSDEEKDLSIADYVFSF